MKTKGDERMALKHAIRALFKLRAKKGDGASGPPENRNKTQTKPKQRASETDVEAAITELATHLRQMATNGHAAAAGSIQVLGLEDTKKHFGPKWPRIAERVHRVIADIIEVADEKGVAVCWNCNKQDLAGALKGEEIAEALCLGSDLFKKHHWEIHPCSAVTGQGLVEGMDWMVKDIASRIFLAE